MPYETEKRDPNAQAELSEHELRLLFDNMISPFSYYRMLYDADGRPVDYIVLAVNKAFELETGLRREEIIGKNIRNIYPQTEPYWIECFGRVAKTGTPENLSQYSSALDKWYSALVYSPKPDHVAITIADITRYITERDELERIAQALSAQQSENFRLAHVEPISGLPNRACLCDAFAAQIAGSPDERVLLAIISPDNLVDILASYGSTISDRVMRAIAQRVNSLDETKNAFFSMTGTDLVLLTPALDNEEQFGQMLKRVLGIMREPVEEEGISFYITAKCGVAAYPADGTDREDLIMKANLALYQAKKCGEPIVFYSDQIGTLVLRRTQIRNSLPKALIQQEFDLYYQPQLDLHSGRMLGVEALLRWHSPEFGEVSPIEFIGVAEKSKLILPLGKWVLETACATAKRLERERNLSLRIAVNVSGVQLAESGFFEFVMDLLRSLELAPERLELEITESVVFNQVSEAMIQLNRLTAAGVRIALDDFGTGYSTLSLLKDLKVSTIKIDRSFVQDPSAQVMNRVIVRLGHILGAKVVAEGVETQRQMDKVRYIGCDAAQRYLLSVPMPFDELLRWVDSLQADAILL